MTRNLFNALLPLGIQVRDEIFAVNGKPVRTWQEFASALGEAAKLDSPEGFGTFSLGVRRNGVMREFTYYLDPAPPATEQIEMLRGTMVAYIQTLALSLLALLQPRHIETCNGDSGLTIGSAEAKNLAALNIKDGDFIARLNGKEFDSVEATLAAFNELAAQVGEKKLDSFTIEGWRGELTPLKVTVKAT